MDADRSFGTRDVSVGEGVVTEVVRHVHPKRKAKVLNEVEEAAGEQSFENKSLF